MTTRRRHPNSSPAAALEDDDLLAEILLRLPPQPSSLPRASLTCRRWRRLVRDPGFQGRFRAHHHSRGTAPALGFFTKGDSGISLHPTLDPPDRVPPERFRLQITGRVDNCRIVCCRDGLALLVNVHPGQVLFQVVLVRCIKGPHARAVACVYSSDTGAWGDLIQLSTPLLRTLLVATSGALVGRSLYWSLRGNSSAILEFDLDRQNLAVIPLPLGGWIMSAEGGGLGLVSVSGHTAQLWKGDTGSDDVATWWLTKTIHLDKLLPLSSEDRLDIDFTDENNMLILGTVGGIGIGIGIFTVHIESMQCTKLPVNFKHLPGGFQPFSSVYTPEMGVGAHAGA